MSFKIDVIIEAKKILPESAAADDQEILQKTTVGQRFSKASKPRIFKISGIQGVRQFAKEPYRRVRRGGNCADNAVGHDSQKP